MPTMLPCLALLFLFFSPTYGFSCTYGAEYETPKKHGVWPLHFFTYSKIKELSKTNCHRFDDACYKLYLHLDVQSILRMFLNMLFGVRTDVRVTMYYCSEKETCERDGIDMRSCNTMFDVIRKNFSSVKLPQPPGYETISGWLGEYSGILDTIFKNELAIKDAYGCCQQQPFFDRKGRPTEERWYVPPEDGKHKCRVGTWLAKQDVDETKIKTCKEGEDACARIFFRIVDENSFLKKLFKIWTPMIMYSCQTRKYCEEKKILNGCTNNTDEFANVRKEMDKSKVRVLDVHTCCHDTIMDEKLTSKIWDI